MALASEAVVQTVGQDQILPVARVSDPQQAERVLGGTAQLEFPAEARYWQLFVEQQVRQELLAKQAQLRKLVTAAIEKNQEALKRSNGAIADLSSGSHRKTLVNLLG